MATLSINKTYADATILLEADLDNIKDDVETFLNVTKINDDNIQNSGITGSTKLIDRSVTTTKIALLAITSAEIANNTITANEIGTAAVGASELSSNSVSQAALQTSAVITDKISNLQVTTAKIAASAVTRAKQEDVGEQITASNSGSFLETTGSFVAVTNMSVTITSSGRPIIIGLTGDNPSGFFGVINDTGSQVDLVGEWRIKRDTTVVSGFEIQDSNVATSDQIRVPGNWVFIEKPAAATYTYTLETKGTAGQTATTNITMYAYEL